MRVRATVLAVVPAVALGLTVVPQADASSRPEPVSPSARPLSSTPVTTLARPAFAAAAVSELAKDTTQLVVRTRTSTQARTLSIAAAEVGDVSSRLSEIGYATVTVPTAKAASARARLLALPGVESVRPAVPRTLHFTTNDPAWSASPSPQSSMYASVQAPAAWDVTRRGAGVTIAVLDGGFAVNHPDLAGKVAVTYDAVYGGTAVADGAGDLSGGHGTATASTAAAATNNGKGGVGAAPNAKLMLVQVGDDQNGGAVSDAASAAGILWATDNGADIISMSYGSSATSPTEQDAVSYAVSRGVLVVASAGNEPTTARTYPAAFDGVLAVAAANHTGTALTSWTTRGSWVDLAAPGEAVRVAAPVGSAIDRTSGSATDGYGVIDGTSFSAPMVAGLAAVVLGEHPGVTAAQVSTALTSTTRAITSSSALAHGLVQVRSALATFSDDTVLTAPTTGDYSGNVTVTATSSAPTVTFSVDGTTTSVTADVVAGTATAQLPLYGLVGTKTIRAVGCASCTPGVGPTTVSVNVTSAAPVLTAPVDSSLAELTLDVAATADGGSVKFLLDGATSLGVDTEAPYALTIDTARIANGSHTVTAVGCNPAGTTCETAPSNAASITVRRLRPAVSVSPTLFSPNADGRRDTATVSFTLEQPQAVSLSIYNGTGALVRGPLALGSKAAGTFTYVWNGKNNSGGVVADGTYRVELSTTVTVAGTPWIGRVSAGLRSDRTKPALSSTSAVPSTFYPYVDGYRDTTTLRAASNEAVAAVTITIYSTTDAKVRSLTTASKPAGWLALAWNGKNASGRLQPAGTYKFTVLAQDPAGNQALTGKYSVVLSSKKLVKKSATKVLSAKGSLEGVLTAPCSKLFSNVRSGWPTTSLGYFSAYYTDTQGCIGDGIGDIALGWHRFTLPSAPKYGTVAVWAYGGSVPRYTDRAQLTYVRADGETAGAKRLLYYTDGTYKGPTVAASSYVQKGRVLEWAVATAYDNWYEVKNFTVAWTYYVLA